MSLHLCITPQKWKNEEKKLANAIIYDIDGLVSHGRSDSLHVIKRAFDIVLVVLLAVPAALLVATFAIIALILQGRPVFYVADRMGRNAKPFKIVKFRTMIVVHNDDARALGGDSHALITPLGHWMRKRRVDELPQIWNVFWGDMSFVGPRPPLERYVRAYPTIYSRILSDRPGITGLATVMVCAREERVLATCHDAEETDEVYRRRCIPVKARIDAIYERNQSVWLDFYVIYLTVARMVRLPGRRAGRLFDDRRRTLVATRQAEDVSAQPIGSLSAAVPPAE